MRKHIISKIENNYREKRTNSIKLKLILILFLLFTIFPEKILSISPNDSLVAYWSFDDFTANDQSGNGYHGKICNHPTFVPGVHGKGLAIRFKGKGIYIPEGGDITQMGDHVLLPKINFDSLKEFTLMFWVYEEGFSYPAGESYVNFGWACCGPDNAWVGIDHCGYDTDNSTLNYSVGAFDHHVKTIRYPYDYSDRGKWIHLALSFKNNHFKAFKNGRLVGEKDQDLKITSDKAGIATHWYSYNGDRQCARFSGMIDDVKIYNVALDNIDTTVFNNPCSGWSFDFKEFGNTDTLNFVGSARKQYNYLRLAQASPQERGAVWYKYRLPVNTDFTTEFKFRYSHGSNEGSNDSSLPGADGIAFVIQNAGLNFIGWNGGSIGYSGIPNSLAIEFDAFSNDKYQIENFNDPNGNHLAIQSKGNQPNTAVHDTDATLAIKPDIILIKQDSTVYYVKIEYLHNQKSLSVFIDTTGTFASPALKLSNFDLTRFVTPDQYGQAFLGITSATGLAFQNHDILSWKYCTNLSHIISVEDNGSVYDEAVQITPSPANDFIKFKLKLNPNVKPLLKIYDLFGRDVECSPDMFTFEEPKLLTLDLNSFKQGIYFYLIRISNTTYHGKFIILKQ